MRRGKKMKALSNRQKKWIERTVTKERRGRLWLYNRFLTYLLLVVFQIVVLVFFLYSILYKTKMAVVTELVLGILKLVALLYLLRKNERPTMKMGWVLMILLLPVVGVPAYFLYGEGRPTRSFNKKLRTAQEEVDRQMQTFYQVREDEKVAGRNDALSAYLNKQAGYPAFHGGNVWYFSDGEEMFAAMKAELAKAEKYILLEYFIIAHGKMWNEILKILLQKAEQGVKIRIIYDDFGCMMSLPPKYERYLESLHKNIRCMTFNDVVPFFSVRMNNRDHRKILVVDGRTAFTGGVNIADEYIHEKTRFGRWKDTGVQVAGNCVRSFIRMFFSVWNAFYPQKEDVTEYLPKEVVENADGVLLQPYDDSPFDSKSVGQTAYLDVINRAVNYVYIFTPYLLLDESMQHALCMAAERGVDVRIVTPGTPDKKMVYRLTQANYPVLLQSGVKIYEYTPGFIHAKSILSDDTCAIVGTINFDYRSLYYHYENALYFSEKSALLALKKDCEETFAVCKQCTKENMKRGVFRRLADALLRIFETLL